MTKPSAAAMRVAERIAKLSRPTRQYEQALAQQSPPVSNQENLSRALAQTITPTTSQIAAVIDAEFRDAVKAMTKLANWLDKLILQLDAQVRENRGRFDSVADACEHDAKQYRIAVRDARAALAKLEGTP